MLINSPLVVTVILNTNRRDDTIQCLESLSGSTYSNHHILVLDNASTDGSVETIRTHYPGVEIIQLTQNLGYAGNNNVGIRAALEHNAKWVFVLNEDTILDPHCINKLIECGESNPHRGIVGPLVYHHNEPNIIQSAGGWMDSNWHVGHLGQNTEDNGQFGTPKRVEWISGCALMIRSDVIEQIGMLDERFFYYYEETEWCLRARNAGWEIYLAPDAHLWHKGVQRDYRPGPNVTYYATRNRLLMLRKHHAPLLPSVNVWLELCKTLLAWTIKPKWKGMRLHRDAMWQGMNDFLHSRWGMRPTRA